MKINEGKKKTEGLFYVIVRIHLQDVVGKKIEKITVTYTFFYLYIRSANKKKRRRWLQGVFTYHKAWLSPVLSFEGDAF